MRIIGKRSTSTLRLHVMIFKPCALSKEISRNGHPFFEFIVVSYSNNGERGWSATDDRR